MSDRCIYCGSKNIDHDEDTGVIWCNSCGETLTDDDIY